MNLKELIITIITISATVIVGMSLITIVFMSLPVKGEYRILLLIAIPSVYILLIRSMMWYDKWLIKRQRLR